MTDFNYSNVPIRPSGPFLRAGAKVWPGIRKVQQQIIPYAEAWQQHNARAIAGEEPLWVVLGDSMSQGIGASRHDRGWVGQLHHKLDAEGRTYRILNLSMSGARIRDVLDRQLPAMQALAAEPDLITVLVGSNDLVRKKFRVNALSDYEELLQAIPEGSVVGSLIGAGPVQSAMYTHLQQVAKDRQLTVADIRRDGPGSWRGKVAEDFFHPNEAGYATLADVFYRVIN